MFHRSKWLLSALILLLGSAASAAFLSFGIVRTNKDSDERFQRESEELVYAVQQALRDYELFGLWIHESCFKSFNRSTDIPIEEDVAGHLGYCSRKEFHRLYEHIEWHIDSQGFGFLSAQWLPNITHDIREVVEEEARQYYEQNYPQVVYQGFKASNKSSETGFSTLPEQPFYFPVHYVEPVESNERAIDLDIYTHHSGNLRVDKALSTWKPVLSQRLKLVQETDDNAYGITLAHPGIPPSDQYIEKPTALSQIVIRVPSLLERATQGLTAKQSVYLYDSTGSSSDPDFLGATHVEGLSLPEVDLAEIDRSSHFFQYEFSIADRRWTVATVSESYEPRLAYIIAGGCILLAGVILFTIFFHTHIARVTRINELRSQAEADKAKHARIQALRERQLNEFMAHEVRNPLSSAISALSFVKSAVQEPSQNKSTRQQTLHDIGVMDASLQFINGK